MNRIRFSIAGMLVFVALVAVTLRFWPIPDGLASSKHSSPNGEESFAEFIWFDDASGMVELDYTSSDLSTWSPSESIVGDQSVISLHWGSYSKFAVGGGEHTQINIQLPKTIHRWQRFNLKLPQTKREIYPTPSAMDCERSLMNVSEIAITRFSNPGLFTIRASESNFDGELKILGVSSSTVTINLRLANMDDFGMDDLDCIYALERRKKIAE